MSDGAASLSVVGHDETSDGVDAIEDWCEIARQTLADEGVEQGTLDVFFVDEVAMQALNLEHMGVDKPTDVLAFPLDGPDHAAPVADAVPLHLGDVVLCPHVAETQAAEHCGDFQSEMTLLAIHGVLHVLGHDHAEPQETIVMQARERHHMSRHGHTHPAPA